MSLPMIESGGQLEDGFKFIKRVLLLRDGDRTVWVWVDTYTGDEGGKCSTKREAWKWARLSRRGWAGQLGISLRELKRRAVAGEALDA